MSDLYEEADRLLEGARRALSVYGNQEMARDDSNQLEKEHVLPVNVVYGDRRLKIEFVTTDGVPDDYRYNVRVFDAETGERLGRGNGGSTWGDAFSNYQWQGVVKS